MSTEPEPDIRPGHDPEPDRVASMRLRAERPRVTRLSRKVLAGGAAIGSLAIFGAAIWALQNNRSHSRAPSELYTTDHHNVADGLTGLPRDYAGVPRQAPPLGPALPGDLGRPILNAQNAPSATVPAIESEQQRIGQEIEAARVSKLFASTGIRELALPSVQSASPEAATPVRRVSRSNPPVMRPSRRMARTANLPSSTRQSIVGQQARTGSPRRRHPMWCRRAT